MGTNVNSLKGASKNVYSKGVTKQMYANKIRKIKKGNLK